MKKAINRIALTLSFVVLLGLSSCNQQGVDPSVLPSISKIMLTKAVDGDTRIEIYADQALHAGYNKLYVRAICNCDGTVLRDAHVELSAQMHMSAGIHTAPVDDPLSSIPNTQGLFECGVVCTMPSGTDGDWTLLFGVHNHRTDTEHEFSFAVTVQSSSSVQVLKASDGQDYFCILDFPVGVHSGMNDYRFLVYHHSSETQILALDELTIAMNVIMTDMGHGSSGNVSPTSQGEGCYNGKVNLSMSGNWNLTFTIRNGSQNLGTVRYPLHI